ncbi:MAG TPA: biosynthetic-type acetolactate synthase large subunit [Verrucomicrobiota bacterium]|jgi:acetolactate synthase-1/2/3 large subunit|nr:biosynthetic-type acetolactate synthase large subunit [Verrucomicrobiota bacterium]HRT08309.1 biosynthetic-type acetolactate synthase large subunit [Candidatus Paceibacterota bacterium]
MIKTSRKASARKQGERGPAMSGSEILVACLEREGVDTIFAYPGGASMEIHQALTRSKIRTVLPRHEQGGAFAAGGYARATGRAGVCMATSGPGATNLVTGIADAYMDSVPLIAITGQVNQAMIGKGAFQETDIYGMTLPVVKHSYLVTDVNDIPRIIKEAFYIAQTGRPGPVLIDLPKNVQQARTQPVFPTEVNLRGYDPYPRASDLALNEIIGLIEKAERPVLYVGGGIITGNAAAELRRFAEATQIPVTSTLMGCGAFPEDHPLSLRWLGMHGAAFANWAVNGEYEPRKNPGEPMRLIAPGADLLLAFGVRFDDRVTGKVDKFCERGTIVHIDIDPSEINKNKPANLPIVSDIKYALGRLVRMIKERPIQKKFTAWHRQIEAWKAKAPFGYRVTEEVMKSQHMRDHLKGRESEVILPQMAIDLLYQLTQGEAIITTGVGQHQMWTAQFYRFKYPRQLLTSAGLGAMGYGYPAALGAKVAFPDRQVIDIDGDGSFLMNIQELATAHIEKIAAKAIILNNQHLGMVMQWEDRFYGGNRGNTYLGDPDNRKAIYPDYVAVCNSFNVKCERVMFKKDLPAAMERMLAAEEPYVLDIIVPYTEHVLPFIPAGRTVADMIWEP